MGMEHDPINLSPARFDGVATAYQIQLLILLTTAPSSRRFKVAR
jgi:hypothetical protein